MDRSWQFSQQLTIVASCPRELGVCPKTIRIWPTVGSENVEAPKTTRWWFVLSQTLGELSQLPPGDPTVVTYTALCHLHNVTGHRNWSQDSEARDEPFQHILTAPGQLRFWTMDLGVPNSFSPLLKMSKGSFHIFSREKNTDSLTLRLCMVWICALPSKSAKLAISRPRRCGELHRLFHAFSWHFEEIPGLDRHLNGKNQGFLSDFH